MSSTPRPSMATDGSTNPVAATPTEYNLAVLTNANDRRLTKVARLNGDGELDVRADSRLSAGKVKSASVTLTQLPKLIEGMRPSQCLTFGIPKNGEAEQALTTKGNEVDGESISRSNDHFTFPDSPAFLFLDFDRPPVKFIESVPDNLREILPALGNAPMVAVPSSSSFLYNGDEELTGLTGLHVYVGVESGTDIPEIAERLKGCALLAGRGYADVHTTGKVRVVPGFDDKVFQPIRQVFAAGADCVAPVEQRRPLPKVFNADAAPLSLARVPSPSGDDLAGIEKAEAELRESVAEEAAEKAAAHREAMKARGLTDQDLDAMERGDLTPTCKVDVEGIGEVTVQEILDNPEEYDGKRCLDPREPDYRPGDYSIGKIFTNGDSDDVVRIHSYAHGPHNYRLGRNFSDFDTEPVTDAADDADAPEGVVEDEAYHRVFKAIEAAEKAHGERDFPNRFADAQALVDAVEDPRNHTYVQGLLDSTMKRKGFTRNDLEILRRAMEENPDEDPAPSLATLMENPDLLKPPAVVIPRLVYKGRTTLFVGPDKSGKSTAMAHAVKAKTRGTAFLGEDVEEGRVLIVAPDESTGDTVRRLVGLGVKPPNVRVLTQKTATLLHTVQEITEEWEPDLIVFDSLIAVTRIMLGAAPKSGDSSGWSEVIRPIVDISHDYDVGVCILHHARKSDGEARDSTEITAGVDGTYILREPGASEDQRVRHISGRARWTVDPFSIRLIEGEGYELYTGHSRRLSKSEQIVGYVRTNPGSSTNAIFTALGGDRNKYYEEYIPELKAKDLIENRSARKDETAWYPTALTSRDPLVEFIDESATDEGQVS